MPINRRRFCSTLAASVGAMSITGVSPRAAVTAAERGEEAAAGMRDRELRADLVIVGGGLGGCSAAIAALRNGLHVIMTEESGWIGGQLTSQGVPPDEHASIETHGANASYRELRSRIRDWYRRFYPLTEAARSQPHLNPGNGNVSRLCCEPRVALAVLQSWLAAWLSSGQLTLLSGHRPVQADVDGDHVRSVTVESSHTGRRRMLQADYFLDATELGDLLPLAGAEYVTGAEARSDTGELHAAERADAANQQAFTMCFAVDYRAGEDHTIDRPGQYGFWRDFVPQMTPPWPGRLLDFTYTHPRSGQPKRLGFDPLGAKSVDGALNLWTYRRIIDASLFEDSATRRGMSLINWPQNDFFLGNLVDVPAEAARQHLDRARQLSLSLLYWLQTEAPTPQGGTGFPGLRLRPDVMGSHDGLAKMPYVRESRRIRAEFTVLEEHVGLEQRMMESGLPANEVRAIPFPDSVGVGSYAIDLHPSTAGDNYIDFPTLPFQVPLGALLPVRVENLIPACRNIGTTHLTNGCYRLHPVEWGIGEAAALLTVFARRKRIVPRAVRHADGHLSEFHDFLHQQGVETAWPNE